MAAQSLVWPVLAMGALTFAVLLRLFFVRLGELRRLRIHPQAVATSAGAAAKYVDTRAADNFRNLFELPVLFYAACGTAVACGTADGIVLALAWLFVALRVVHSLIHCSYNRVMHRFTAYAAGAFALLAMWAWLAWRVLS